MRCPMIVRTGSDDSEGGVGRLEIRDLGGGDGLAVSVCPVSLGCEIYRGVRRRA